MSPSPSGPIPENSVATLPGITYATFPGWTKLPIPSE
jgi:hypothetical protein